VAFFTEREGELPPRTRSDVPREFAEAVVNELIGLADRWWLARGWPIYCPERAGVVIDSDRDKFWQATRAKLNLVSQRLQELPDEPDPLAALNVIEYVYDHIAFPIPMETHTFYGHKHLDFDGAEGKRRFRDDINELFARYGLAFELRDEGTIIRLAPEEIHAKLVDAVFNTGDNTLDGLLNTARTKYLSPNAAERREGLEKLWDAFERLKTIGPGKDKKAQITALIELAYADEDARNRFNAEFNELTAIGNRYNIRHFEKDKLPLPDEAFVNWLFARCYAAVYAVLDKTGRIKR
jgi:hypothetical protein